MDGEEISFRGVSEFINKTFCTEGSGAGGYPVELLLMKPLARKIPGDPSTVLIID